MVLLFGASSGLGYQLASEIISRNKPLIIVCRNNKSLKETYQKLNLKQAKANITGYYCDLSSIKEVKELCFKILKEHNEISTCLFCAAQICDQYILTNESIEVQLATNHLSSYVISCLLFPIFKRSENCKVYFFSSRVYKFADPKINMLLGKTRFYHPTKAYADSKLMNIIFSNYIASKWLKEGIKVITIHPGLMNTKIGNKHSNIFNSFIWNLMKFFGKSPEKVAKEISPFLFDKHLNTKKDTIWHNGKSLYVGDKVINQHNIEWMLEKSFELSGISQNY